MSDLVKQRIVMMITNTVTLAIFGALSVFFNHWWIVFFSVLFFHYEKRK